MCGLKKLASGVLPESWKLFGRTVVVVAEMAAVAEMPVETDQTKYG